MPLVSLLRDSFQHAPRTLRLVWKSSPRLTAALGALTLVSSALPLGIAWAGKRIVDAVVAKSGAEALRWVLVELCLMVGASLSQRGLALARQILGARLGIDINLAILDKALGLDLRHFEDARFYDQLTRARREASSRPVSVVSETFQLLQNLLTFLGYVGLLWRYRALAVVALIVAAVPATVAEMRYSQTAFRLRNWRSPDSRKLNYLEYVLGNERHVKEVKLFGLGPLLFERYRRIAETFYREDSSLAARRAAWAWGLSLLASFAFYGCYAMMAVQAARGDLTLGNLTLYVVAFRQGQQAFQSCLGAIGGMYEDNLYMSNLFEFLAIPTSGVEASLPALAEPEAPAVGTIVPKAPAAPAIVPAAREESGIRFEGVGFRYPAREDWALRGVDLFVPAGRSLALVGQNGAGKTTFIKLLTRLYEPTEGRILLDGKDLRAMDIHALRRRIGVVFQDFNQYQLPAGENVGLGNVPFLSDVQRVERAVELGGAGEVIRGLPAGLSTQLGGWFQDGTELSGGQWQKIALARGFMREEADILILDEPTAALDAEAEHAVFERFRTLARGRTAILISHRFPTVRMADRIVVLEHGAVVEQGTHDELVAEGGRYARLFSLQAQGYL